MMKQLESNSKPANHFTNLKNTYINQYKIILTKLIHNDFLYDK